MGLAEYFTWKGCPYFFRGWNISKNNNLPLQGVNWLASRNQVSLSLETSMTKVGDLMLQGIPTWDMQKLRMRLITPQTAIETLQTPISWFSDQDFLYWHFSSNGRYSVRYGYKIVMEREDLPAGCPSSFCSNDPNLWPAIWGCSGPWEGEVVYFEDLLECPASFGSNDPHLWPAIWSAMVP